ncbi:thioredoxin family protein [bacterium]|nr:thioredoxin family protein [bacterium]MBP9809044.1 thioredoxin family protein [bacterium]
MIKLSLQLALSGLLAISSATAASAAAPIFSQYSYAQAKQKAEQDHRLLLIDFTASWCPPCKKMESSTWPDEALQAWVKENAIAIQIDVDEDKKTTSALNVSAMPTLVLFSTDGSTTEVGRQVGLVSPAELLRWLKEAKSGKSGEELEKAQVASDDGATWERISGARQLMMSQKNAEALEEYLWLWNNLKNDDQTFGELRLKMVPVEIKQLCASYPAAKTKMGELRDAAEKTDNRADWIILNGILDDNTRTLTWFDTAKSDPKKLETINKNSAQLEPVLFSNCRWADAAKYLYPQPLAKIAEYHKRAEDMKKPRPDTEVSKDFDPFPSMILLVYGAYIGANKEADAQKIADECLRLDDTPAMHSALENMAKSVRAAREALSKASSTQRK